MSEWISVEDELPTKGVYVLACYLDEYTEVCRYHQVKGWQDVVNGSLLITHWMPLPAPPEESNEK